MKKKTPERSKKNLIGNKKNVNHFGFKQLRICTQSIHGSASVSAPDWLQPSPFTDNDTMKMFYLARAQSERTNERKK